eukprot:scaffold174_cov98-Cylindrotheca_fusiformis.AAC.3
MSCIRPVNAVVEIKETETHGKALVSTECLDPGHLGLLVFREEALLACPNRGSKEDKSGPVPHMLEQGPQMWTDWWAYQQQPKDIKKRILDLYCEIECPHGIVLRRYLEEKAQIRREHRDQTETKESPDSYDILDNIDEFVQFTMVVRFNSVQLCPPSEDGSGPGTDFGHGIFETACRMNHSCRPNCVWVTEQSGRAKIVRAIKKIEEGEELTVDYVGQALSSVAERREELWSTKGFLCHCDRCAASVGDDTRRFACIHHEVSGCNGVHLVHQPRLSSTPRLLSCSLCGTVATEVYTRRVIQDESRLRKTIQEIDEVDKTDESGEEFIKLSERIKGLTPPHRLHGLAEECYRFKGLMYSLLGDHRSAAEAYSNQIDCRIAILGDDYLSQTTAFICERLGDTLTHVDVKEAEEAYKRSVRDLLVMRGGGSDPYSKCVLVKLLTIQSMMKVEDNLPRSKSHEPVIRASVPQPKLPCEVCGNPSIINDEGEHHHLMRYCCDEHQRLHFSAVVQIDKEPEEPFHKMVSVH